MEIAAVKVKGIDISHYQSLVNWTQVKASGKAFAFIKATEGTSRDPLFSSHYANAKAAGLLVGAYHFFHPKRDPVAQANTLLNAAGNVAQGDLPHAIDVEWADGFKNFGDAGSQGLIKLLNIVEEKTGVTPIIYTVASFFKGAISPDYFLRYPLWVADYGQNPPRLPAPWKVWSFFQYSEHEPVPGVGKIDVDLFNGSMDQLLKFTKK